MIWRNIYGDFERNELHCFAQPRADGAFCLYCGAACVLHVVLPRQHPDGGECGEKSGAGHPGDGAGGQPQRRAHRRVRDRRKSLCEPHEGGYQGRGVHGLGVREFSGAIPRGRRTGCGHKRDGGERAFGARWRDGGEHHV